MVQRSRAYATHPGIPQLTSSAHILCALRAEAMSGLRPKRSVGRRAAAIVGQSSITYARPLFGSRHASIDSRALNPTGYVTRVTVSPRCPLMKDPLFKA